MKAVLSIAGSDSSGGAGIQADIKTIASYGLYAETVITAITAQNTCGVRAVQDISPEVVGAQIDAVFEDIRPDAVKIGMVSSAQIINVIAERLRFHQARNVVVDPVMVATSGSRLIEQQAVDALVSNLVPLADVITPNMPEAEVLCGFPVADDEGMMQAAKLLSGKTNGAVLVKGGHRADTADDLLVLPDGRHAWLRAKRIATGNTHGTGCTLSSAIASGLAQGNGTSGIMQATSMVSSYFDPLTKLIYAVGAVVGLIGGIKVYQKFSSGDPDTSKTAASWFGACIFLVIAGTVLRSFFL